jgi:DNA-binding beta-propeller fold protein YncE
MERRLAVPVFAALGVAAITGSLIRSAAAQDPAPGTIVTFAGTRAAGFSGDGGPASQARLSFAYGVAVDAAGNVLISDAGNHRIRKVAPDGMIVTVARLNFPTLIASDRTGHLFISDGESRRVRKVSPEGIITVVAGNGSTGFSGDGGPATAAPLNWPRGLAVDAAGNLFIADHYNHRIRKVSPEGIITTVAGSGQERPEKGVSSGDGGLATEARLNGPHGLALDQAGNLYFAELGDRFGPNRGYRVRKVDLNGIITTVAGSDQKGFGGDGGPATQARLYGPAGVAVDSAGALFIADEGNYRVRKVDANGVITTVAGIGRQGYAIEGAAATATGLLQPIGLAVDAAGNLLIADGDRVLKVVGVAAPGLIAGEPLPNP